MQTCCLVFCPTGTTFAELAGAAGLRWTIAERFQRAKDDLGLDHREAPFLARLAPVNELGHGRRRFPCQTGRGPAPCALKQTEQNESKPKSRRLATMTALEPGVQELRYLLAKLLLRPPVTASLVLLVPLASTAPGGFRQGPLQTVQEKRDCSTGGASPQTDEACLSGR